jgi:hypothetical protein
MKSLSPSVARQRYPGSPRHESQRRLCGFTYPEGIKSLRVARSATLGHCAPKVINPGEGCITILFRPFSVMPQSLAKILIHTVFSTKERRPFLGDPALRGELHRYLGGILGDLECQPIIVGGVQDHVHLLASLSRTCHVADMVKELKARLLSLVEGA